MRRITALLTIIIFALATLTGCGKADQQTLTVYAAASLNKSFTQIAKDFEKKNPGVVVKFSFGGSSDLVEQIKAGADAHSAIGVIATMNSVQMYHHRNGSNSASTYVGGTRRGAGARPSAPPLP